MICYSMRRLSSPATASTRTIKLMMSSPASTAAHVETLPGAELTIPVPWGVIAGRCWGDAGPSSVPWLAVHGWLDNAGTFDRLLGATFPPGHRLVAIDYPGHGLSSPLPPGASYHYLDSLVHIARVTRHLGWDRFCLLGHSMGAGMCSLYAATFPEQVAGLVQLDNAGPLSRDSGRAVEAARQAVTDVLAVEERMERPDRVYATVEEAVARSLESINFLFGNVDEEAVRILLKRGLKKNPDGEGFVFTRDLRHKAKGVYGLPPEALSQFGGSIRCPHLVIRAKSGPVVGQRQEDMIKVYRDSEKFEFEEVEGGHHVHLTNPDIVRPILFRFVQSMSDLFPKNSDS